MNVLFFCEIADPGVGSSVRQMYGLARELRARGHKTAVVATVREAADATPTVIEGTTVFRLHSDYPLRWRGWVSLRNRAIERPLAAVLGEFRPDVVHAHLVHTHLGYHSLTMAKQAGARVIFTSHDAMTFCYQKLTCFHGGEAFYNGLVTRHTLKADSQGHSDHCGQTFRDCRYSQCNGCHDHDDPGLTT